MILMALFAQDVRLLALDEAGRLGFRGLEAVGILVDRANALNEDFHVVLVGMERLPATMRSNSRIRSRVGAWESFDPLPVEDFGRILSEAYPKVLEGMRSEERERVIRSLHAQSEGSLREVLGLLGEAELLRQAGGFTCTATNLLALHRVQRATAERLTAVPERVPQMKRRAHQSAFPRATA